MERIVSNEYKHSKDYQPPILLSPSDIEYLFFEILQKYKKDYENSLHKFE